MGKDKLGSEPEAHLHKFLTIKILSRNIMRLTATKIFLGILLTGIRPIRVLAESSAPESIDSKQTEFEFLTVNYFKVIKDERGAKRTQMRPGLAKQDTSAKHRPNCRFDDDLSDRSSAYFQSEFAEDVEIGINTALLDLTVELDDNYSRVTNPYSGDLTQKAAFTAGVVSWQSKNRLGSWKFDGKFDDSARFIQGKAYLSTPTVIGLVELSIYLNNRIKPVKTVTGWRVNTPLGNFAVKGNFNEEIIFTGGNATWNAKTSIASFGVKGNFNRETKFTSGNFKIASQALIGSFQADIKIDEESKFNWANASWNTNLLFGSNIGVSGRFDDTNTFTGGKIELGARSGLGIMSVKANLDRDTQFTSGSVFWKTKTKLGSINLDADLKKDGNFASKLGLEFSL